MVLLPTIFVSPQEQSHRDKPLQDWVCSSAILITCISVTQQDHEKNHFRPPLKLVSQKIKGLPFHKQRGQVLLPDQVLSLQLLVYPSYLMRTQSQADHPPAGRPYPRYDRTGKPFLANSRLLQTR